MDDAAAPRVAGVIVVDASGSSVRTGWLYSELAGPVLPDALVRPHIAFVMGDRLAGAVSAAAALGAVSAVCGAIEVIPAGAPDGVSGEFLVGARAVPVAAVDLTLEACLVEVGGQVVDSATGAAVLGNPARALALAAGQLAGQDLAIEAGWVVLAGGLTAPVPCPLGVPVAAHFTTLGSVFVPPAELPAEAAS